MVILSAAKDLAFHSKANPSLARMTLRCIQRLLVLNVEQSLKIIGLARYAVEAARGDLG